jgi:hypothetical protein
MRDSGWGRGFTIFSRKIVDALRAGETTVEGAATFADGYRTQVVLDAARRSFEKGSWQRSEGIKNQKGELKRANSKHRATLQPQSAGCYPFCSRLTRLSNDFAIFL